MQNPRISAVIPTHNRPQQLHAAVASVLAQTMPPHEIIVVDDGSRPEVDPQLFNDLPIPVQVVRNNEAQGVASARNLGVKSATGDFIAFLDDDDSWLPLKLEISMHCLNMHPDTDVLIHRVSYRAPAQAPDRGCALLEDALSRMIRHQPPHSNGVVIRRSVHMETQVDEGFSAAEDVDHMIRLAKAGIQIVEMSAVLAIVSESTESAIGIEKRIQGRLKLLDRHPEILSDREAASFFFVRLGHLQRRAGKRRLALRSFLRAGRHKPSSALVWKGFVHCLRPHHPH